MLKHRTASEADVKVVMASLSEISSTELDRIGASEAWATQILLGLIKNSEAITFLQGDEPIAILAFSEQGPHHFATMFMATEGFFGGSARPSLYLRRFLDNRFAEDPRLVLESVCYSDHEKLHRWYRLMNYEDGVKDERKNCTVFLRRATGADN